MEKVAKVGGRRLLVGDRQEHLSIHQDFWTERGDALYQTIDVMTPSGRPCIKQVSIWVSMTLVEYGRSP